MEKHDDAKMIAAPPTWPMWPFLPMKRSKGNGDWPDMGYLVHVEGYYPPDGSGPVTLITESLPIGDSSVKPLAERAHLIVGPPGSSPGAGASD